MTTKGMVENIVTTMRGDQERIAALDAVLSQKLSTTGLAILREEVETEISRRRADLSYRKALAEAEKDIDDAGNDTALISALYSLTLGQMTVGTL